MKLLLVLSVLALGIMLPATANAFEAGEEVFASFFCLDQSSAEHLRDIATNPKTTHDELNIETGILIKSQKCFWLNTAVARFIVVKLLDTYIDYENDVIEMYEMLGPDNILYYGFTPVGKALEI